MTIEFVPGDDNKIKTMKIN